MKNPKHSPQDRLTTSSPPAHFRNSWADPLNLISLAVFLVWGIVGSWFRPIGDYGVETDFYGDFVPFAREWMQGKPNLMSGYRGPFYYLVLGSMSVLGDAFVLAKILSAACAGLVVRLVGHMLKKLWNSSVALAGCLFLAANPTFMEYSYRASTDLFHLALVAGALALMFAGDAGKFRYWVLAGIFAGLAYLTRYNGLSLVPMGIVGILIMVRPWKRALQCMMGFGGAWLLVVSPWLGLLWRETGDPVWNRNFALITEEVYGRNPSLANIGQLVDSVGFASLKEAILVDPLRFSRVMAANVWNHVRLDFQHLVGPAWGLLGLAGFALLPRSLGNRRRTSFVVMGAISYVTLLPVFYNQRFMLTLLIWWSCFAGLTAGFLIEFIKRTTAGRETPRVFQRMGTGGHAVLIALAILGLHSTYLGVRRSQGEAGGPAMPLAVLKLAEEVRDSGLPFGETTPIGAQKPHVGYYLGAPVSPITQQGQLVDPQGLGMHYLLVSDIECRIAPSLAPMLTGSKPTRQFPGYHHVASATHLEKSGFRQTATLYAVEDPGPRPAPVGTPVRQPTPGPEGIDRLDYLRARLAVWYMNWTVDQPLLPLFSMMGPESREHPDIKRMEGDAWLASMKYDDALSSYIGLRDAPGAKSEDLLRLALTHHLMGHQDLFDRFMTESAHGRGNENPTAEILINEAADLCRTRDYIPATALLVQIRLQDPGWPTGEDYRLLGYCFLNFRHPDRARDAFEKYLEHYPGDPEILDVLATDSRLVGTDGK